MSFGTLFLPPEERLKNNLAKLYVEVVEDNIRQRIRRPDPALQKATRNLGRLFSTSTDDPEVIARAKYGSFVPSEAHSTGTLPTVLSHPQALPRRPKPTQSITQVISSLKHSQEPRSDCYVPPVVAAPSASAYNTYTPKLWALQSPQGSVPQPTAQKCPSTQSHSLVSSTPPSQLSSLQSTLVECGRLSLARERDEQRKDQALEVALQKHKKAMVSHVNWMQGSVSKESWHLTQDRSPPHRPRPRAESSSNQSVHSMSTISQSQADSWLQLSAAKRNSKKGDRDASRSILSGDLDTATVLDGAHSLNPFRRAHTSKSLVKQTRRRPRPINPLDSMDYKDDVFVRSSSAFNAVIQPSVLVGATPSQQEVSSALFALTRKQILSYSTRVVEVGSLIRHLKDSHHATPGLQAILSLHEACVAAAALSTNPFILSRKQLHAVLEQQVPWLGAEAVGRLLMAFDTTNTGYVRFVRLTSTTLAAFGPAMAALEASLDRSNIKAWKRLLGMAAGDDEDASAPREAVFTEEEFKAIKPELLVVRFLHRLYCETAGCFAEAPTDKSSGTSSNPLMSLFNLQELFSCCSCCPEDEKKITELLHPMLQEFLERKLPGIEVNVKQLVHHDRLRVMLGNDGVTSEEIIEGLLRHTDLLKEFVRQVRAFRKAAQKFVLQPSKSIEDSLSHFASTHTSKM